MRVPGSLEPGPAVRLALWPRPRRRPEVAALSPPVRGAVRLGPAPGPAPGPALVLLVNAAGRQGREVGGASAERCPQHRPVGVSVSGVISQIGIVIVDRDNK